MVFQYWFQWLFESKKLLFSKINKNGENADQNNSEYGLFLRNGAFLVYPSKLFEFF